MNGFEKGHPGRLYALRDLYLRRVEVLNVNFFFSVSIFYFIFLQVVARVKRVLLIKLRKFFIMNTLRNLFNYKIVGTKRPRGPHLNQIGNLIVRDKSTM